MSDLRSVISDYAFVLSNLKVVQCWYGNWSFFFPLCASSSGVPHSFSSVGPRGGPLDALAKGSPIGAPFPSSLGLENQFQSLQMAQQQQQVLLQRQQNELVGGGAPRGVRELQLQELQAQRARLEIQELQLQRSQLLGGALAPGRTILPRPATVQLGGLAPLRDAGGLSSIASRGGSGLSGLRAGGVAGLPSIRSGGVAGASLMMRGGSGLAGGGRRGRSRTPRRNHADGATEEGEVGLCFC